MLEHVWHAAYRSGGIGRAPIFFTFDQRHRHRHTRRGALIREGGGFDITKRRGGGGCSRVDAERSRAGRLA